MLLCTGVLTGAFSVACNESGGMGKGIVPMSRMHCIVLVKTTPGEETVLFAKSVLTLEGNTLEMDVVNEYLQSEYGEYSELGKYEIYGKGNMIGNWDIPVEERYANAHKTPLPEAMPDCYELTMTVNAPESFSEPYNWGFYAFRINGTTRSYKWYGWAFTEDGAAKLIPTFEAYHREFGFGGEIVDITIKKLGQELLNESIEF